MSTKLSQENPELATLIADLDSAALQKVMWETARSAIAKTGVTAPLVTQVLGQTPDPAANTDIQTQLDALADQTEDPYLDALDKDVTVEDDPELMKLFGQARAITSLSLALSDNPEADAPDALYEALHAGVEPEAIKRMIEATRQS